MVSQILVDLLYLFPMFTCSASLAASIILLRWISRLNGVLAQKLMSRQLWHLALADLLASVLHLPISHIASLAAIFGMHRWLLDWICFGYTWCIIPTVISVFIEIHIALATVFALFRFPCGLRCLSSALPFVWPLGFIVGGVIILVGHMTWKPEAGGCHLVSFVGEIIKTSIMIGGLGICAVAYLSGVCMAACNTAGSVQQRVWRRANMFVASGALTWLPYVVYVRAEVIYSDDDFFEDGKQVFTALAFGCLFSNGLLNAAVYALQCRFVRQMRDRASTQASPIHPGPQQGAHMGAFSVAFSEGADVLEVGGETALANNTAEREIRLLEEAGMSRDFASSRAAWGRSPDESFADAVAARSANARLADAVASRFEASVASADADEGFLDMFDEGLDLETLLVRLA